MKRVLIIGGSGFIGARLARRLLELCYDVRILDRSPSSLHAGLTTRGDVRDAAAVRAAAVGMDCIINLAAERRHELQPVSLHFDISVSGAENVVAAAIAANVPRVVYLSSAAVYGTQQPLAEESTPLRPESPYGQSKAQAEAVYSRWVDSGEGRSLLMLRSVVVFGEGHHGNIHLLAEQIRRRRFLMVGPGHNRKSIAYVGNLVEFIAQHIGGVERKTVLNYADSPDFSTTELVQRLAHLCGADVPRWRLPFPAALAAGYAFDLFARLTRRASPISALRVRAFCAETRLSIAHLKASGFIPPYSLDEGLARMVAAMPDDPRTQENRSDPNHSLSRR
jgi:nucleoside-diphosphate-sugar epimerase